MILTIELEADGAIKGVENLGKAFGEASTGSNALEEKLGGLWKQFATGEIVVHAVEEGLRELKQFMVESVTAYLELEKATIKFNTAVEMSKGYVDGMKESMAGLAESMGNQYGFQNDQIKSMMAYGLTIGATSGNIGELTQSAIGLSEIIGGDLQRNMKLMVKVSDEDWGRLKNQIPTLKEANTEEERHAALLQLVATGLKQRTELMDSDNGTMIKYNLAMRDLQETTGKIIMDAIGPSIIQLTNWIKENQENIKGFFSGIGTVVSAVAQNIIGVLDRLTILYNIAKGAVDLLPKTGQQNFIDSGIAAEKAEYDAIMKIPEAIKAKMDARAAEASARKTILSEVASIEKTVADMQSKYDSKRADEIKAETEAYGKFRASLQLLLPTDTDVIQKTAYLTKVFLENQESLRDSPTFAKKFSESVVTLAIDLDGKLTPAMRNLMSTAEAQHAIWLKIAADMPKIAPPQVKQDIGVVRDVMIEMADGSLKAAGRLVDLGTSFAGLELPMVKMIERDKTLGDQEDRNTESTIDYSEANKQLAKNCQGSAEAFGVLDQIFKKAGIDAGNLLKDLGELATGIGKLASGDVIGGVFSLFKGVFDSIWDLFANSQDAITQQVIDNAKEEIEAWKNSWQAGIDNIDQTFFYNSFGGMMKKVKGAIDSQMLTLIKNGKGNNQIVQDFISSQLGTGADALNTYMAGVTSNPLTDIKNLQSEMDKLAANDPKRLEIQKQINDLKAHEVELTKANNLELDVASSHIGDMFNALVGSGKSYVEAINAIGPALDAMIAKSNGSESPAILDLEKMRGIINANKDLFNQIDATNKIFLSLGNTAYLTQDSINAFAQDAKTQFDKLINAGVDADSAYRAMAPSLANLLYESKLYGFTLDANTQALIDQAKANGVNFDAMESQDQLQRDMRDALVSMDGTLGDLSKTMKDFVDSMKPISGAFKKIGDDGVDAFGRIYDAASGAAGKIKNLNFSPSDSSYGHNPYSGPTPYNAPVSHSTSSTDNSQTHITISLPSAGSDPRATADAIINALNGNINGLTTILKKKVA